MARDVEYNVTANDKSGTALAAAAAKFEATQKRIDEINKQHAQKREKDLDASAAKVGRSLESAFGKAAPKLAESLAGSFAGIGEAAGPALAVGIAAAAPLIGATMSAAIIGGAGVGGVIGGVILAARDPRVAAAGVNLVEKLLGNLQKASGSFIEPVLVGLGTLDRALTKLQPRFEAIFSNSSKFVAPLTDGIIRFTDGILRGFEKLTAKGGPVIDQLADSIGDLGEATGDMFTTISGGAGSAADGLEDVTDNLSLLLRTTGFVTRGLTEIYGAMEKLGIATALLGPIGQVYDLYTKATGKSTKATDEAQKAAEDHAAAMKLLADQYDKVQEGVEITNGYLERSEKIITDANQATRDLITANGTLYDSETALGGAIDAASDARKKNGKTLDANTEKGRANRDALSGVAKALQGQFDAFSRVNAAGPKTVALGESLRSQFVKTATSFGLSGSAAKALADKILNIPPKKKIEIETKSNAESVSRATKEALNSIHSKTVNIDVVINAGRLSNIENRLSRLGGSLYNAGGMSWAALDSGSGVARTGGPSPVNVSNNVSVSLDGTPFYAMSMKASQERSERDAWRQKVGRR